MVEGFKGSLQFWGFRGCRLEENESVSVGAAEVRGHRPQTSQHVPRHCIGFTLALGQVQARSETRLPMQRMEQKLATDLRLRGLGLEAT